MNCRENLLHTLELAIGSLPLNLMLNVHMYGCVSLLRNPNQQLPVRSLQSSVKTNKSKYNPGMHMKHQYVIPYFFFPVLQDNLAWDHGSFTSQL